MVLAKAICLQCSAPFFLFDDGCTTFRAIDLLEGCTVVGLPSSRIDAASSERSAGTKHTKSKRAKTLLRRVLLFSRLVCVYDVFTCVRVRDGSGRSTSPLRPLLLHGRHEEEAIIPLVTRDAASPDASRFPKGIYIYIYICVSVYIFLASKADFVLATTRV